MPSSQPVFDFNSLSLLIKLFGGLAVIILGLLGRKKIYEMLAGEAEHRLQEKLNTNQTKEQQSENNVIRLTQKKQDIEQQLRDVDNKVQETTNANDAQILDFFKAEQTALNDSKTK